MKKNVLRLLAFAVMFVISLGANAQTVGQDVDHALAVEQAKLDDMLVVNYDVQFTHFRLPPLTLQPIAENAVKHGLDPYSGPLCISIRTRLTDSGAEIIVEDNGPGFDPSDENKKYITLNNIRDRLKLMWEGSMTIHSKEGKGTVVTITIPYSHIVSN